MKTASEDELERTSKAKGPSFELSYSRIPRIGKSLRTGLDFFDQVFDRIYGSKYNPLYQSGTIAIGLLLVMLATGIYTFLFYQTGAPHESIQELQSQWWGGRWIRSLHHYSANASIVVVAIHFIRMFLQGRCWGPRALAWVTGVILLGLMLLCGWTGIVLVWDVEGQIVAREGARNSDFLPIFPEKISRLFVSNTSVPGSFFFINLFIHLAIPLGIVLVLWIHLVRVAKPTLLPPRRLLIGVIIALLALSIIFPIALNPKADLESIPGIISINWYFNFWLPWMVDRSPIAAIGAWSAVALLFLTVPWWWRPKAKNAPQPSLVIERYCEGCYQCFHDCPFEAISMIPRTKGSGSDMVARVASNLCVSCGICAGSCPPMVVGPPPRVGRDLLRDVGTFCENERLSNDKIAVVTCVNNAGIRKLLEKEEGIASFPVECTGSFHSSAIYFLQRKGAKGVFVWGCAERNCQSRKGPELLDKRLFHDQKAALPTGVDLKRLCMVTGGKGESKAALEKLNQFRKSLI